MPVGSVVTELAAGVDVLPFGVVVGAEDVVGIVDVEGATASVVVEALVELDVVIGFGDIQPAPHIDVVTVGTVDVLAGVVDGAGDVVGIVVV